MRDRCDKRGSQGGEWWLSSPESGLDGLGGTCQSSA